jgi:hypothetical protein
MNTGLMSSVETLTKPDECRAGDEMSKGEPYTIRCYVDRAIILRTRWTVLSGDRLLAAQALQLLMRLDAELSVARADWNQDRFRRVMQARSKAALRVFRRWPRLNPQPAIPLGNVRRRYHANPAGHLYEPK